MISFGSSSIAMARIPDGAGSRDAEVDVADDVKLTIGVFTEDNRGRVLLVVVVVTAMDVRSAKRLRKDSVADSTGGAGGKSFA